MTEQNDKIKVEELAKLTDELFELREKKLTGRLWCRSTIVNSDGWSVCPRGSKCGESDKVSETVLKNSV